MAMRRSGKPECSRQFHAPVSLSSGNWILWKPGVDPLQLRRNALRSFQTKRLLKMARVIAPISLLVAAIGLIDLSLMRIPIQAWVVVVPCLVLLIPPTRRKWDMVERRSRLGRFDEYYWMEDLAGSQCITRRTTHRSSAADRIVAALATIAYSRASTEGWIHRGDVLQLHEIAWGSLTENHAVNLVAQGELLDETAATMERAARESNRIDAELQDLEKGADLDVLTRKFRDRQSRAQQISADFEARLRFLREISSGPFRT